VIFILLQLRKFDTNVGQVSLYVLHLLIRLLLLFQERLENMPRRFQYENGKADKLLAPCSAVPQAPQQELANAPWWLCATVGDACMP
jgi:hypothetical protein